MSIQHMPVHREAPGQLSKNFSMGCATRRSNLPPLLTAQRLLVSNRILKGPEDRAKQSGLGCTSSSLVARNVKRFPRKFLLLQEDMEGNQENFDTFQAVGVSMK